MLLRNVVGLVARMMLFLLGQNFALPASKRLRPWQARNGKYLVAVATPVAKESLGTAATAHSKGPGPRPNAQSKLPTLRAEDPNVQRAVKELKTQGQSARHWPGAQRRPAPPPMPAPWPSVQRPRSALGTKGQCSRPKDTARGRRPERKAQILGPPSWAHDRTP